MRIRLRNPSFRSSALAAASSALTLVLLMASAVAAAPRVRANVFPPAAKPYGASQATWSASWWQWALALPVAGHPFGPDSEFQCDAPQPGPVWFLGATFGTSVRSCVVPAHTPILVGLLNVECSDLEGSPTEADQRDCANFFADGIRNLFLELDGSALANLERWRFVSPQFSFTAPSPWIFGPIGGSGTAVSDGYFVMLKGLPVGTHTLHYGGDFHFSVAEGDPFDFDAALDTTYTLEVQ